MLPDRRSNAAGTEVPDEVLPNLIRDLQASNQKVK
jgi:hypothetical protein